MNTSEIYNVVSLVVLPVFDEHMQQRAARYGVSLEFDPIVQHSARDFSNTIRVAFGVAADRLESQLRRDFGVDWRAMFRGGGCE